MRDRGLAFRRQWRIVVLLRQAPRTLADLTRVLRVTTRTIRRDLALLVDVGIPVQKTGDYGKGEPPFWFIEAMPEWPRSERAPVKELRV